MPHLNSHRPNSLRLSGYNYKLPGFYFVTLCSYQKQCLFASIDELQSVPTPVGLLIQECWQLLSEWFPNVSTDHFTIMPNHVHAIIELGSACEQNLSTIISSFKSATSRRIYQARILPRTQQIWQRGYFDHIIRSEPSLMQIRQYILDNPGKWHLDKLNPDLSVDRATHGVAPTEEFQCPIDVHLNDTSTFI